MRLICLLYSRSRKLYSSHPVLLSYRMQYVRNTRLTIIILIKCLNYSNLYRKIKEIFCGRMH